MPPFKGLYMHNWTLNNGTHAIKIHYISAASWCPPGCMYSKSLRASNRFIHSPWKLQSNTNPSTEYPLISHHSASRNRRRACHNGAAAATCALYLKTQYRSVRRRATVSKHLSYICGKVCACMLQAKRSTHQQQQSCYTYMKLHLLFITLVQL